MLDRQKGNIVFECDVCGEVLETNETEFDDAKSAFRRADWKAVPEDKGRETIWHHYCPDCKGQV